MGGFRSFFIEYKLFQLVIEEGGNFFSLKIFERGKYYMQSVFMGKCAALWTMWTLEHTMSGLVLSNFSHSRKVILLTRCDGGPTHLGSTYQ